MGFGRRWSEEEKEYLKKVAPGNPYKEIQRLMIAKFDIDYTAVQIKSAMGRYKLNTGLTGRFQKGSTPFNKGKKGLIGANRTSFKKGQRSHNWVPIGTERITRDGYIQIKIQDGHYHRNWRGKHILIWEKVNGKLPQGHVIIFGDGDNRNFNINNLLLITRGQLAIINKRNLIKKDVELTKTGILIADLYKKMNERK